MKIQVKPEGSMLELRKLLRLSKSAYAVTIPKKYLKSLGLKFGDHVEMSLWNKDTLRIKRHVTEGKS